MKLRTKKILTIFIATLVLFYSAIWLFSPSIAPHFINKQLAPLGLNLSVKSHLRYNPFISTLTLKDIEIHRQKNTVFKLKEFTFSFHLLPLVFKELKINTLTIDGLYLTVKIEDDITSVMGIPLPAKDNTPDTIKEDNASFGIFADQIALNDTEIDLTFNGKRLLLDTSLVEVNKLDIDESSQSLYLLLKSSLAESAIVLDTNLAFEKGHGTIDSNLQIKKGSSKLINSYFELSDAQFKAIINFSGQQKITITPDNIALEIIDNELSIEDFLFADNKVSAEIAKQALVIPSLTANYSLVSSDQPLTIVGEGNFEITNTSVNNIKNEDKLAEIQQLISPRFSINIDEGSSEILLESIAMNQAIFSKESRSPALFEFSSFTVNAVNIAEKQISISAMTVHDVNSQIFINEQGELEGSSVLNIIDAEPKESSTLHENHNTKEQLESDESSSSALPYHIKLDQFSLTGNNTIEFTDKSVSPTYQRDINIDTFTIQGLDSRNSESITELTLKGKSNEYANFDLNAQLKHFAKIPEYAVSGKISEVSLPAVSSYIKDQLQHEIKSGQLDVIIDSQIQGTSVSGKSELILRGLDFTASDDHEAESLKDQTAIPFSIALGMLKDSQGNINLDIPLSGDTTDPSFGTSGLLTLLIKQATMAAAKDYLLTTFVPYANVVSIAMAAGEQLLKVRFNDLEYQAKQTSISDQQKLFVTQFSQLLIDKQETQVTICPIATPADIGQTNGNPINEPKQIAELAELSQLRFHIFKQYVVDHYKVDSSRLLMCSPQIDSTSNANPRLTFST